MISAPTRFQCPYCLWEVTLTYRAGVLDNARKVIERHTRCERAEHIEDEHANESRHPAPSKPRADA